MSPQHVQGGGALHRFQSLQFSLLKGTRMVVVVVETEIMSEVVTATHTICSTSK